MDQHTHLSVLLENAARVSEPYAFYEKQKQCALKLMLFSFLIMMLSCGGSGGGTEGGESTLDSLSANITGTVALTGNVPSNIPVGVPVSVTVDGNSATITGQSWSIDVLPNTGNQTYIVRLFIDGELETVREVNIDVQ